MNSREILSTEELQFFEEQLQYDHFFLGSMSDASKEVQDEYNRKEKVNDINS